MSAHADPIIVIKHLNVTYFPGRSNEVRALKDINLEIYPGEFIIFFGPSGCGKSTLLYSIAGLERNVEGKIIVKNDDLANMKLKQLEEFHQNGIGMIFQSFYLIPSLTVVQNVILPQMAMRTKKSERYAKAIGILEKFGVVAQAHKLPTELSGGQQQRIAISRSLMNDPDILIADEPVGNLDSKSSQDVMDLLRHLNDDEQRTVILVTHDPSHLRHAHRIFYLRDGVITGTKTNTEEERNAPTAESLSTLSAATLSHWAKAYAPSSADKDRIAQTGEQSQRILAEVLTGLAVEELQHVQMTIQKFLDRKTVREKELIGFLTKPIPKGGIGMDKRKAKRIAHETAQFARQLLRAEKRIKKAVENSEDEDLTLTAAEAIEIRRVILHSLDMNLTGLTAVKNMDDIIRLRLEGALDRAGVQKRFHASVSKKGAGMGIRMSRSVARHLEPFITFKPKVKQPQTAADDAIKAVQAEQEQDCAPAAGSATATKPTTKTKAPIRHSFLPRFSILRTTFVRITKRRHADR